jgi:transposase-like protein
MPFKESSIVSQREELCRLALAPGANRRELSRRFGVSPTTLYGWLARYLADGSAGLADRSRRPMSSPTRTSAAMEQRVLEVRGDDPWGGRKLRRILQDEGMEGVPSASPITEILRRHGKLDGPGAGEPRAWIRFEYPNPNDMWQMDFKGHFPTGSGRCHPLTVIDDHSRFALVLGACADETAKTVSERLLRVFHEHGLPRTILADNGSP